MKKLVYPIIVGCLWWNVFLLAVPSSICIVVHGTWAQDEVWWKSGGTFFEELKASPYNAFDQIIPFSWSGYNTTIAREKAGFELAQKVLLYDQVTIVAHSHGGNVAIIASQYLAQWLGNALPIQGRFKIKKLYVLGTPVRTQDYNPNMNIIGYLYNLFSFEDMVQPVLGLFGRVFPAHQRIANLSVQINGQAPGHSEFQVGVVARDLLAIHETFQESDPHYGFEKFSFLQPGTLSFSSDHPVTFMYENDRLKKLEQDLQLQMKLLNILRRGPRTHLDSELMLGQLDEYYAEYQEHDSVFEPDQASSESQGTPAA